MKKIIIFCFILVLNINCFAQNPPTTGNASYPHCLPKDTGAHNTNGYFTTLTPFIQIHENWGNKVANEINLMANDLIRVGVAGATIYERWVVYLNRSDGKWYPYNVSSHIDNAVSLGISVTVGYVSSDENFYYKIASGPGVVTGYTGLTNGLPVYADPSVTAGLTSTPPTALSQRVVIGYATSTTDLVLNWNGFSGIRRNNSFFVDYNTVEIAASDGFILNTSETEPSGPTDTGNKGEIRIIKNGLNYYLYICVEDNIWRRATLSSF